MHLSLDEVRFMPNAMPPHKEVAHAATNEQRLQMVELAIADVSTFYSWNV